MVKEASKYLLFSLRSTVIKEELRVEGRVMRASQAYNLPPTQQNQKIKRVMGQRSGQGVEFNLGSPKLRLVLPTRNAFAKPACLSSLHSRSFSHLLVSVDFLHPFPPSSVSFILPLPTAISPTMPSSKPKRKSLKLASRPPKHGKSPLMSAPPEVRVRIYRYVFQGCRLTIRLNDDSGLEVAASMSTTRKCGILLSCKTFRQESQPIFGEQMSLWLDTGSF